MNTGRILLCAVVVLCACTPFAAAHTVIGGSSGTVTPGSAGSFLLGIGDVENCEGIALTLAFDPGLLSITGIEAADPASGTRVIFMTDNDAGTARIVVTCPEGITVATDECEPVLKVSYTAGDATGDATVEIISATRSTEYFPAGFDEINAVVITIAPEAPPVAVPAAAFSAASTTGTAPLPVAFTDLSGNEPSSWAWTFGDGGTATVQHPSHTYAAAGTYTVTLTAANEAGSDTATRQAYITVLAAPEEAVLDADFIASVTTGTAPLEVQFTDLTAGTPERWGWVFGDGGTANVQHPAHVYSTPGTYSVSLLAGDGTTTDRETKSAYIVVTAPVVPAPEAAFNASVTAGTAPLEVAFTDSSTGDVSAWSWDFGDGATAAAADPVHTYTVPGTYNVTLTVTGPGGSDTIARAGLVTVGTPAPDAWFDASPASGTAPLEVRFSDLSTGDVSAWSWDFGDGIAAATAAPAHIYTVPGTYTVTLTVTGAGGSDTVTRAGLVTVAAPVLVPDFTASVTAGTAPLEVQFTDLTVGKPMQWAWIFGDGGSANVQHPVHVYSTPGTYTVSLLVGDGTQNLRVVRSDYITVTEPVPEGIPPVARFAISNPLPVVGDKIQFIGIATDADGTIKSYAWDLGDGTTSTKRYFKHAYKDAGTYTVTLTVTDDDGMTDSASCDLVVRPDGISTSTSYIRIS